jgi:hypothetical protein
MVLCDFRGKMLLLTFLTLNFVRGETPVKNDGEGGPDHDPWRESNQPKIFVDYLRKPLSGNTIFIQYYEIFILSCKIHEI